MLTLHPGKAWVPQSPTTVPEFPSASAFTAASPQGAPPAASRLASRQRGDGEVAEGPGEREWCLGGLVQPFLWPQGQHQATSPLHLSQLSPSSPLRPLYHPHLRPRCCSPYLQGRGGKGFFWGCPGPPAPHPFSAGTALPASPQTKHPPPFPLSAMGGEREEEEEGDEEPSCEPVAC